MAHHVMIDLETLGLDGNAIVPTIGMVKFDIGTGEIIDRFDGTFNLKDQAKAGRTMDVDTVRWWMTQSEDARNAAFGRSQEKSTTQVLREVSDFMNKPERVGGVWGNGAAFDNVILKSLFNTMGVPVPWNYRQDFCYRTFRTMFETPETYAMEFKGTKHNALDDAMFQTEVLLKLINNIRLQQNQSMMLGRLLGAMSGMLTEQVTAEDLMEVETTHEEPTVDATPDADDGASEPTPETGDGPSVSDD